MRQLVGRLRRVKRPVLLLAAVWLVVYVPLAVGLSQVFPENRYTARLDTADIRNETADMVAYVDRDTPAAAILTVNDTVQQMRVDVQEGYVPVHMELQGYGSLYNAARFDANRTWTLPGDAVSVLNVSSSIWTVSVEEKRTDVLFYRARGEALLDGRLLYRDVFTAAPPLINLFWLLPVMLGGSFLVFRLYFACFALLLSLLVLRFRPGGRAPAAALFVLVNPLTVYSTLLGVQDDVIVALFYGAALYLILRRMMTGASMAVGAAIACKLWPVLLLPSLLPDAASWPKKIGRVALAGGMAVASIVPFAVLAADEVLSFLRLYVSGDSGQPMEGIAVWRYLGELGFDPAWMVPVFVAAGVLFAWLVVRRRAGPVQTAMLFLLLFLLLFPKLHSGYYLPLLLFVPLLWHKKRMVAAIMAAALGAIALDGWNWLGWHEPVPVPLLLAAAIWLLLAWMLFHLLQTVRDAPGSGGRAPAAPGTSPRSGGGRPPA
jgi:hypothetical protein